MKTVYKDIEILEAIKKQLKGGFLSYDEAKDFAQPVIDRMNEKAKEICKKNQMPFKAITFIGFMR